MSRLRRPGCKRRIRRLRVRRLKFGNGNPGQFEKRSCSLPLGSVLHRWRPIPVKEGFPLPEVTDQSKVCPGHEGDEEVSASFPKEQEEIRSIALLCEWLSQEARAVLPCVQHTTRLLTLPAQT